MKRIWGPAEDGNSHEDTCPAGDGDPVSGPGTPTRWWSQLRSAASWHIMCLMLEFLPVVPGDFPSLGFPKSRPEIRVQGQGVYWKVLVTPGQKGDVIWGRGSSGHRVLVTPATRVGT